MFALTYIDIAVCIFAIGAMLIGFKEIENQVLPQLPEGAPNPFIIPFIIMLTFCTANAWLLFQYIKYMSMY